MDDGSGLAGLSISKTSWSSCLLLQDISGTDPPLMAHWFDSTGLHRTPPDSTSQQTGGASHRISASAARTAEDEWPARQIGGIRPLKAETTFVSLQKRRNDAFFLAFVRNDGNDGIQPTTVMASLERNYTSIPINIPRRPVYRAYAHPFHRGHVDGDLRS